MRSYNDAIGATSSHRPLSFLPSANCRPPARAPPPKKKFPAVGKPHMAQVYRHDAIMRLTVIVLAADRALAEA